MDLSNFTQEGFIEKLQSKTVTDIYYVQMEAVKKIKEIMNIQNLTLKKFCEYTRNKSFVDSSEFAKRLKD